MTGGDDAETRANILVEFLEVAFHSILYFRNIYPKSMFSLKKKYQTPIHVSIHPGVNNYLTECLKTALELLKQNAVKSIALVILGEDNIPVEKHCFDLENSSSSQSDQYFVKTEENYRQYLLKLSVAELEELPGNCTFQIHITTTEECSVRLNENVSQSHFPWIEAEKEGETEGSFRILPIKTVETEHLTLNMYVER